MQATNIPVKVIKGSSNFFPGQICLYFDEPIGKGKCPNCLKLANITSVFEKGSRT